MFTIYNVCTNIQYEFNHAQSISMKIALKNKDVLVMHIHLQAVVTQASVFRRNDGAAGKRPTKQSFRSTAIY